MAIYRYDSGTLLDEVRIIKNSTGGLRACLHARGDAAPGDLAALEQALNAQGYKTVPLTEEGKPYLEVRGFQKSEELFGLLNRSNFLNGSPTVTPDTNTHESGKLDVHNRSLKLAGYAYNVGDASYLYYKAVPLAKEWKAFPKGEKFGGKFFGILDVVAGVGYALGSLCLTFFGSRDQSVNTITAATKKIERYTRKEGITTDDNGSLTTINQEPKRSFIGRIKHTLERYPSEALNSIYVFVGLFLSAAAVYHATRPLDGLVGEELVNAKKTRLWNRIDVGLGAVTAASAITGIAVKEHKRVEGDPKRRGIGGFIDWIREKPLRATGYGYMIATGFHAVATWGKWKDKSEPKQFLIGRVIFIVANIAAELLLAISSKGHGVGVKSDSSVDTSVIAATAEAIAKQHPAQHEVMIHQLAGYMASPEVLGGKADSIATELRTQVANMKSNPWAMSKLGTPAQTISPAPEKEATSHAHSAQEMPSNTVSHVEHHAAKETHHSETKHAPKPHHDHAPAESWKEHAHQLKHTPGHEAAVSV